MDLINRGYIGDRDRKLKNAKRYILVRSALIGKQKRNIYIKDSKEYIKHNGKYVQLKKYMENMINKEILQINKGIEKTKKSPCKQDCVAKNKICNTKTKRCNKIKEKKVSKRAIAKQQKDFEIFAYIFMRFYFKNFNKWVKEKRFYELKDLLKRDKNMAIAEIKKDAINAWNSSLVNRDNIGKKDFYMITKALIKKYKKPLNEMTLDEIDNEYHKYIRLRHKRELRAEIKLLHENPSLYMKKYPQYFNRS